MSKRISVRIRDPNPLFRSWISNWATVAENEDKDQLATSLRRALLSLEKYPLKLNTGKDCLILDGFGANICEKLDAKLTQYQNRLANPSPLLERNKSPVALPPIPNVTNQAPKVPVSISQSQDKPSSSTEPKKRIRKTKSEQTLPKIPSKPSDEVLGTSTTNAAVGTKRKATTTIDSVIAEEVIMVRGTFEIILLVDSMETVGKNKRHMDLTILELEKNQTHYEVRRLNIGDFAWIARDTNGNELVLPYIVERKRLDDLAGSIKSGRYQEQKFRLKNSGIPNVTYLIEYLDVKHYGLPIQTLYKAVINSEVHNDCQVKFTDGARETILYLSVQTTLLTELFREKTLCSCSKENLEQPAEGISAADTISLLKFGEFNQSASKWGAVTIKDFFVRQLVQLFQMSVEKAMAITNVYPTPRALLTAYSDSKLADDEARRALLSKIPYGAGRRTIGPSLSKIIFDLYHTQSPG